MKVNEIREKYLKFFEERGHKRIPAAPLVLENDSTTLFTSSGMQPLVPHLMGEPHPEGKRLVDSQPSIRTQDIDEVGDNRHTTFFEMLGHWSLGDYFKAEQLPWFWEFLTKELALPKERLWVSVFEGTKDVPKDTESFEIWKKLEVPESKIHFYGVDKNWWSRSGTPEQMPVGEIGGPDSEVFFDFGEERKIHENSSYKVRPCHPNCECGRFLEIGNSVFIQYKKTKDGLEELPQKNVDFGGGLERIVMATEDQPDIYRTEVLSSYMQKVEKKAMVGYGNDDDSDRNLRIVAEHMRASEALIKAGVVPSNKQQGYVLRRLLRRAAIKMRALKGSLKQADLNVGFPENTTEVVQAETDRFSKTLERGLKEFDKFVTFGEVGKPETKKKILDSKSIFHLYDTYGFPYELSKEEGEIRGIQIPSREEFELELDKHINLSRTQSAGTFKGGLADHSEEVTKLHTATHLLHEALRRVLGSHVAQKGSNITADRLRFDFTHTAKLTDEEIKKVEDLINEQVEKKLPVSYEVMTLDEAKKKGALAFFGERYGEKVKVYSIGPSMVRQALRSRAQGRVTHHLRLAPFSREVCGGPHVKNTAEVGRVRITKQERVGAGVVRIYATVE